MRNRLALVGLMVLVMVASMVAVGIAAEYVPGSPLKAGFIYIGPIGDYGWSHAHDVARKAVLEQFPWLSTVYVESVPEGDAGPTIDKLINDEHCNVIFTTSFGYMDDTIAAAKKHPDVIFAHCSGFKRAPNVATYMADFYQVYYLNGLMAGALTKTGKVGYVGAFPIPEVKRHIGAFTRGVREVNPDAQVDVRWIMEWFNPAAAKEATEALIADGCDAFAFTEDSPTVVQVAGENGLLSFAHYSPMYRFSKDYCVSGELVHWDAIYADFLAKIYAGVYTAHNLANVDYWWLLGQGAVEMGAQPGMPINPAYVDKLKAVTVDDPVLGTVSVYDLIQDRIAEMSDPSMVFDPYDGPVKDRKGNVQVKTGSRMSVLQLTTMEWAVDGIIGPWPGEP